MKTKPRRMIRRRGPRIPTKAHQRETKIVLLGMLALYSVVLLGAGLAITHLNKKREVAEIVTIQIVKPGETFDIFDTPKLVTYAWEEAEEAYQQEVARQNAEKATQEEQEETATQTAEPSEPDGLQPLYDAVEQDLAEAQIRLAPKTAKK